MSYSYSKLPTSVLMDMFEDMLRRGDVADERLARIKLEIRRHNPSLEDVQSLAVTEEVLRELKASVFMARNSTNVFMCGDWDQELEFEDASSLYAPLTGDSKDSYFLMKPVNSVDSTKDSMRFEIGTFMERCKNGEIKIYNQNREVAYNEEFLVPVEEEKKEPTLLKSQITVVRWLLDYFLNDVKDGKRRFLINGGPIGIVDAHIDGGWPMVTAKYIHDGKMQGDGFLLNLFSVIDEKFDPSPSMTDRSNLSWADLEALLLTLNTLKVEGSEKDYLDSSVAPIARELVQSAPKGAVSEIISMRWVPEELRPGYYKQDMYLYGVTPVYLQAIDDKGYCTVSYDYAGTLTINIPILLSHLTRSKT